jgi:hypothetical protein
MREPFAKQGKWGVDAGTMHKTGDMGGWTREPCVKRVTWGADVGSVRKTGDVEGGCGIRA